MLFSIKARQTVTLNGEAVKVSAVDNYQGWEIIYVKVKSVFKAYLYATGFPVHHSNPDRKQVQASSLKQARAMVQDAFESMPSDMVNNHVKRCDKERIFSFWPQQKQKQNPKQKQRSAKRISHLPKYAKPLIKDKQGVRKVIYFNHRTNGYHIVIVEITSKAKTTVWSKTYSQTDSMRFYSDAVRQGYHEHQARN